MNTAGASSLPKRLVTAALPYANGPIHVGHLVGYLQADFWVRWNKMNGRDCVYICGDDTHGTPIMVKARELKITPEELIARAHAEHSKDFADFDIEFDIYSSTNTDENRRFAEEFYVKMRDAGHTNVRPIEQLYCNHDQMFLPDRFVKGVCPKCGAVEQYGDSCDKCGATYAATDLKSPGCAICSSTPVVKPSETIAFKVADFRDYLRTWVREHAPEEVANKLSEWIDGELFDWDISRDAPYFGFKIPGFENKYFYVWMDAPIGYISATEQFCKKTGRSFDEYWKTSNNEIYHFIGKDIIKFHCLFWPAMLKNVGFKSPTQVFVNGFLTVNGEKMSKSKGTLIAARTYLNHLNADYLRYYYASKLNGQLQDLDLGLEDFANRVNSDLVGKMTNLGSRGAQMLGKRLEGRLCAIDGTRDREARRLVDSALERRKAISTHFENRDFAKALAEVRDMADDANKYFDERAPWNLIKTDPEATRLTLSATLNVFRQIAIALKPVLPTYADRVAKLLNEKPYTWADGNRLLESGTIGEYEHLATRVETEKVNAMIDESKPKTSESPAKTNASPKSGATAPGAAAGPIATENGALSIDTFNQVDLRIAKIVSADAVPDADKLLKLQVDVGPLGMRQIFAGIKSAYDPKTLEGRLTVIVANLAPRKMKFGMSEGMVLAASDPDGGAGKGLFILSPDAGAKPGDRVK